MANAIRPAPFKPYRTLEIEAYSELIEDYELISEQGASARVYGRKQSGGAETRASKRRKTCEETPVTEPCIFKAQIVVAQHLDLRDGNGPGSHWMSVQIDESQTRQQEPRLWRILDDVFAGKGVPSARVLDHLRQMTTHSFCGEVKALTRAASIDATPVLKDAFFVETEHPEVYLGVFKQVRARTMEREARGGRAVHLLADPQFWRALVAQIRAMAADGLAHLDMNPGNIVVSPTLPIPVQFIDWAEAWRPGLHLPYADDVKPEEQKAMATQWRLTIMVQHLLKTWNIESMKKLEVFTETVLPRIRALLIKEQEKCAALAATHLKPGSDMARLYKTALYYCHRE